MGKSGEVGDPERFSTFRYPKEIWGRRVGGHKGERRRGGGITLTYLGGKEGRR